MGRINGVGRFRALRRSIPSGTYHVSMTRFWISVTVLAVIHAVFANAFEPVGRGKHQLWSGRSMACVFMRKT